MRLPSGEIATSTGGPSTGWLTELISGSGSIRLRTVPFWVIRTMSSWRLTAIVPSSACEGER